MRLHASIAAVAFVLTLTALGRPCIAEPDTSTARYERADTQTIRMHTREILADPQFAPRKTFGQWLREKLHKWNRPKLDLPHGVGRFLLWAVMAWCVLALLAILIDLIWTIWVLARPSTTPGTVPSGGSRAYEQLSVEQLRQRSRELARQGAFREAAGLLLLALLRQLEASEVLRFHTSKTNGDYLREYPANRAGRPQFSQLIATFERSIYGGLDVSGQVYETMNSLAERILADVGQRPQI